MSSSLVRVALLGVAAVVLAACATGSDEVKVSVDDLKTTKEASADGGFRVITPVGSLRRECSTRGSFTGRVTSCASTFSGYSQVVRSDGSLLTWNLVETWSKEGCDASEGNGNYKVGYNTTSASFIWGPKNGESHQASAFVKFTNAAGTVTSYAKTNSCP
jgi:hypothetical protein